MMSHVFTYARRAAPLRAHVFNMLLAASLEFIFWIVLMLVLPRPWPLVIALIIGPLTAWMLIMLTAPLRGSHRLEGDQLSLTYSAGIRLRRLTFSTAQLARAERWRENPPRAATPGPFPCYIPQDDTLYLLADRNGLVSLTLTEPLGLRVHGYGPATFTRIVLSLDHPEPFLTALTGMEQEVPEQRVVTGSGPAPLPAPVGAAVVLDGLSKRFGSFEAVRSLHLQVAPGEVVAFLGTNGAGKTTTMRMMTGLLRPSAGRVLVDGHDVWLEGAAARRLIGYVPDVPLLYDGLTAREFLWLMAGLYGLPPAEGRQRTEELLTFVGLADRANELIRGFSLGMKRKLAIAAALVHRPPVLLLDEVTNGLDIRAARDIKDFISAAARQGTAVFLTTHILEVAQELAHRVAILDQGQLCAVGNLDELRSQAGLPGANLEALFLELTGARGVSA